MQNFVGITFEITASELLIIKQHLHSNGITQSQISSLQFSEFICNRTKLSKEKGTTNNYIMHTCKKGPHDIFVHAKDKSEKSLKVDGSYCVLNDEFMHMMEKQQIMGQRQLQSRLELHEETFVWESYELSIVQLKKEQLIIYLKEYNVGVRLNKMPLQKKHLSPAEKFQPFIRELVQKTFWPLLSLFLSQERAQETLNCGLKHIMQAMMDHPEILKDYDQESFQVNYFLANWGYLTKAVWGSLGLEVCSKKNGTYKLSYLKSQG